MSGAGAIDLFEPRGELDDDVIAPLSFPIRDCGFSENAAGAEYIDGHDEGETTQIDVHFPVPDFVVGNSFNVGGQGSDDWHKRLRRLGKPSKRSTEPKIHVVFKALTQINFCPALGQGT